MAKLELNVVTNTENANNETDNNVGVEEFPDVSFSHQDDSTYDIDVNDLTDKYTKIDCLDEDPVIKGQLYVLLSFISPEGIMNCKIRGLKVRGVYATESEAKAACEKLKKKDKYFDVFIGEVGKWLPWDPSLKHVENVKYHNQKLDKIMSNLHKTELNSLNELVGRRKEMLDKETVSHKNRIKNSIKESVDNYTEDENVEEKKDHKIKPVSRNPATVKQRLQQTLKNKRETSQMSENKSQFQKQLTDQLQEKKETARSELAKKQEKFKAESERVVEKTNNVSELKQKSDALDERIKKLKECYERQKKEKEAEEKNKE